MNGGLFYNKFANGKNFEKILSKVTQNRAKQKVGVYNAVEINLRRDVMLNNLYIDESVYEKIDDDLFGIARRIKRIDGGYFLLRNKNSGKIEVHNEKNVGGTLSLVSPFDTLDIRLVHLLYRTRVERMADIVKEMDDHNEKLEIEQNERVADNAKERLKEALKKFRE